MLLESLPVRGYKCKRGHSLYQMEIHTIVHLGGTRTILGSPSLPYDELVKRITRLLETSNKTVSGSEIVPSNLGRLLDLDTIIVYASEGEELVGVICCFPHATTMGIFGCVSLFCISLPHRKTGLAAKLRETLIKECRKNSICFSYQVTPQPLYSSPVKIHSWYRPINADVARAAGFDIGPIQFLKLIDPRLLVKRASPADRKLLRVLGGRKFEWNPDERSFRNWLEAFPTYVVDGKGLFSLFRLRLKIAGTELTVDHLAWFIGDPEAILGSAIRVSDADLVFGYMVGGLTEEHLSLHKASLSTSSYLSFYGINITVDGRGIAMPLL